METAKRRAASPQGERLLGNIFHGCDVVREAGGGANRSDERYGWEERGLWSCDRDNPGGKGQGVLFSIANESRTGGFSGGWW